MKKTLIVIDMQHDFIYGPLGTPEAEAIVSNVEHKVDMYRKAGHPVIFTKDMHWPNYSETHEGRYLPVPHCMVGDEKGRNLVVLPGWDEPIINKSTFGYTGWAYGFEHGMLDEIEIVGVCTDICVVSNALILRSVYPEINIKVDADCCAGTTPKKHKAALAVMKSCHIDIVNASTIEDV